ncbi:MAG: RNA methyltransferase [Defluviitaleaceae bacterium]|nr:RNA methyltransferase [Defluviitaleaceae bacterium]MCL2276230.1 RNA methyltransferase [Defluviitaleaceae bacterium]
MSLINSTNNFRVKQWSKLKMRRQRDEQKCFIAEGYHIVAEAFKQNRLIEVITTEKNAPFPVPTFHVTYEVMEKLTSMATPTKVLGICRQSQEGEIGQNILLVEQVHHPGNLGTIIRNGAAFGIDTMVVENSADVYNAKVIQASQGMLFHLNIIKRPLATFVAEIKVQGYQIIGSDVREGTPLHSARVHAKRALLLGNEGEGVTENLLSQCDMKVHIPMNARCESLNVGVAAGIILYGLQHAEA